ncbi:hypothetical protein GCM10011586_09950 [Silvibacterium dinghuense]|nr:hypothetical protein GCM10011586_09950 [Silvibacterium dinghuense]
MLRAKQNCRFLRYVRLTALSGRNDHSLYKPLIFSLDIGGYVLGLLPPTQAELGWGIRILADPSMTLRRNLTSPAAVCFHRVIRMHRALSSFGVVPSMPVRMASRIIGILCIPSYRERAAGRA